MKPIRTCVTPECKFIYGIHKPCYQVKNVREATNIVHLGTGKNGEQIDNKNNFPQGDVTVNNADWIFEIPNPLPFRGTTFIDKEWADSRATNYDKICLPVTDSVSLNGLLKKKKINIDFVNELPFPLLLSLATCSTDPDDLVRLAEISCSFEKDSNGEIIGILYQQQKQTFKPVIHHYSLFKAVANNPYLPEEYKSVMVLRPGAQGNSEIVGEWPKDENSHVFEYLRKNSYISGGHYAANMSDDSVRYSIDQLTLADMNGLRHLYYQRSYLRIAQELGISIEHMRTALSKNNLESLRHAIVEALKQQDIQSSSTLWGWNFGYDYSSSGYRLHGSHQQIHQQYAMIPQQVAAFSGSLEKSCGSMSAFSCGDMVAEVVRQYRKVHTSNFFRDYIQSIFNNERMDERDDLESSLAVWQDDNVLLFVPKAQTSQWELQLVTLQSRQGVQAPGNIIEANTPVRNSLDKGILIAQKVLAALGAKMVTTIEFPKRIGQSAEEGQHLLYSFLPKLPESPGAFSEAQLRYINGHYPEDFAAVCRKNVRNNF